MGVAAMSTGRQAKLAASHASQKFGWCNVYPGPTTGSCRRQRMMKPSPSLSHISGQVCPDSPPVSHPLPAWASSNRSNGDEALLYMSLQSGRLRLYFSFHSLALPPHPLFALATRAWPRNSVVSDGWSPDGHQQGVDLDDYWRQALK
ncbi:hypothetical protein RRG08_007234 [Elysia crispata]|uniref:Uncharacterized protein n=1 Tax=Elysia crispata TaxID=231223 RepID=A0AAE0ZSQ0_9GAST|nr:hypothetical protein RRG08_007234 [Elysia crispata]